MRALPLVLFAAGCSEYSFGKPNDAGRPTRPGHDDSETYEAPADTGGNHDDGSVPDADTDPPNGGGGGGDETDPPVDTAPPEEEEPPADTGTDWSDCEDGYWADYFNLPANHADVEGDITGVVTGDVPSNHDWWAWKYFSYRQVDPGLEFGTSWWPVDDGMTGDPQYFAVHWVAQIDVASAGTYAFELGSDDDGWAYIDSTLVGDLGGVHGVAVTTFDVSLTAGVHDLELYMAERHTSDAGFWFKWDTDQITIHACP